MLNLAMRFPLSTLRAGDVDFAEFVEMLVERQANSKSESEVCLHSVVGSPENSDDFCLHLSIEHEHCLSCNAQTPDQPDPPSVADTPGS